MIDNETQFYQWVFEHCYWKLHRLQNKTEKPFASYPVYREWFKQVMK